MINTILNVFATKRDFNLSFVDAIKSYFCEHVFLPAQFKTGCLAFCNKCGLPHTETSRVNEIECVYQRIKRGQDNYFISATCDFGLEPYYQHSVVDGKCKLCGQHKGG
ncbi:MAG: hypothetical protein GY928_11230 [Colwellia sp.]|nr:hypothetical protein [Colwellia sp.]